MVKEPDHERALAIVVPAGRAGWPSRVTSGTQCGTAPSRRILDVVMPGGIERYFEQIAPVLTEHGPDWSARVDSGARRYEGLVDPPDPAGQG